uniref:Polyadenylate-binding protein n=1 Tax=Anemia phyllitidis TaxID=12940 RepID=Q39953_ANEPH|nr:poly(A)-mRNA binding protein [Anemia phyllitidis]
MAQVMQAQQAPTIATPISGSSPYVAPSLYVGDLDPDVSESELYEVFNQIGQVVSIRVCRDLMTKKSLGYAYVNYGTHQDASQALELLNFTLVKGKPIRIMYSHRDPSIRKSGAANIFIKNLEKSIDNKALHDTFSAFGTILSCRVVMDDAGNSKGYGFVQFEKEESAQIAIEKVNGMLINDRQVSVAPFIRKQERDMASSKNFNNVYVKNLAEATTDEDLRKVFAGFGPISSAVVMRDADGKSKCFGFVNFENVDDAANAVENLNGKLINEKEWYVGRAQKKSEREAELKAKFEQVRKEKEEKFQGVNLYLKNIDDSIDDEKLRELFAVFGTVTSCKVMKSPQGQSMGSGFVTFSAPEEAMQAVNDMNGKMVGSKPLYVALAQRKEERRARLQAQFAQMQIVAPNAPPMAPNPPSMYHPGPQGMGHQMFYGQPAPGLLPSQANGFGYQQPMVPTMRPTSAGVPNYFMPVQRPGQQIQRPVNRRGGVGPLQPQHHQPPPQQFPRGGNRSMRYSQFSRTMPDSTMQGFGMMGAANASNIGLMPALASALASASPEEQRVMLGEQLYPLVDRLEHDHAGKVTGMLLEMDQPEVLHLIDLLRQLKAKVAEAMDVLRMAQGSISSNSPLDQLASLSLTESLTS